MSNICTHTPGAMPPARYEDLMDDATDMSLPLSMLTGNRWSPRTHVLSLDHRVLSAPPKQSKPTSGNLIVYIIDTPNIHNIWEPRDARAFQQRTPITPEWQQRHKTALDKLTDYEQRLAGWDGHEAVPFTPATIKQARMLLQALPATIPTPHASPSADGEIVFRWGAPPTRAYISIRGDGNIYFLLSAAKNKVKVSATNIDKATISAIATLISETM